MKTIVIQNLCRTLLLTVLVCSMGYTQKKEIAKDAQKIDVQQQPVMQVYFGVDGDYRKGNIERRLLKTRFSLNYETPKSIVGFNTNPRFNYGTFKGVLNEQELFLDINTTLYAYQQRLYYLAFGIFEKSNLRKINSRTLGGVGIGYRILGDKNAKTRYKLAVTTALIYETTDYFNKTDIEVIRSSTRIKFSGEIIKGVVFLNNNTFIQPALNKPNFRWNAITQLQLRISKGFFVNTILENSYESVVPDGAQNTDVAVSFGLSYSGDMNLPSFARKPKRDPHYWMK
jgi:hypothetical protein